MNISKKLVLALFLVFTCLINAKSQELIPYNNGKEKWGYCDEQSNIKIKPSYNLALPFINNTAITLKGQYTIVISTDGTELLRGKWQNTLRPDKCGLPVKLRGYWGFADKTGKLIIPTVYDELYNFSGSLAPAKKAGEWGFINFQNKEFKPCGCDEIFPFSNGLAVFRKGNKYGVFAADGQEITPPAYDELHSFSGEYATARLDDKYGFLNTKMLFKAKDFIRIWPYSSGLAAATSLNSENKCGYIDSAGDIVIPFIYAECLPFSEGKAAVKKDIKGKYGYIDAKGRDLTKYIYDSANKFINGAAWTLINEHGAWINADGRPFDKFFKLKEIYDKR